MTRRARQQRAGVPMQLVAKDHEDVKFFAGYPTQFPDRELLHPSRPLLQYDPTFFPDYEVSTKDYGLIQGTHWWHGRQ